MLVDVPNREQQVCNTQNEIERLEFYVSLDDFLGIEANDFVCINFLDLDRGLLLCLVLNALCKVATGNNQIANYK